MGAAPSRGALVTTLLAMLELARRGRVTATQPVPFGDIWVLPRADEKPEVENDVP